MLTPVRPPSFPRPWPDGLLEPEADKTAADLLANIQGNILRSHGRDRGALIFWRYDRSVRLGTEFWSGVTSRVTSAGLQRKQAKSRRRRPNAVFCSFAITAEGMHNMGVADAPQQALVSNPSGSAQPFGPFNAGAPAVTPMPADSPSWARVGPHGLWLVAGQDRVILNSRIRSLVRWGRRFGLISEKTDIERLTTWRQPIAGRKRRRMGAPREPFGFVDGISLPAFFESDRKLRKLGGDWMKMPLEQVLIGPGVSMNDRHEGGSFLVVQKLEQDVQAFRNFEETMSRRLAASGLPPEICAEPGALLVGRFRDGRPLAQLAQNRGNTAPLNAFDFNRDREQQVCPFHAHIRKMNPRNEAPVDDAAPSGEAIRAAQLVRRGMVYDPLRQLTEKAPFPAKGTGLMFMAYMSDISKTFVEMVEHWARDRRIPGPSGFDPLLFSEGTPWEWSARKVDSPAALPQFVTLLGSKYFYVPALPWLRSWSGPTLP